MEMRQTTFSAGMAGMIASTSPHLLFSPSAFPQGSRKTEEKSGYFGIPALLLTKTAADGRARQQANVVDGFE
jgi:hypothetical protein